MLYEFQRADGTIVEQDRPIALAPPIGSTVEIEGERVTRIASSPGTPAKVWRPYVSSRLPRNLEGCECTKAGKPIIRTQAQERSVAARLGWERE